MNRNKVLIMAGILVLTAALIYGCRIYGMWHACRPAPAGGTTTAAALPPAGKSVSAGGAVETAKKRPAGLPNLRLEATFIDNTPSAYIRDLDAKKARFYYVGDEIAHAKVVAIRRGEAGLEFNNKRYTLYIENGPAYSPIEQISEYCRVIVKDRLLEMVDLGAEGAALAGTMRPCRDTAGNFAGYRVEDIKAGSIAYLAGLRSGDIIHKVNNQKLLTEQKAIQTFKKIRKVEEVELGISRNTKDITLTYKMTAMLRALALAERLQRRPAAISLTDQQQRYLAAVTILVLHPKMAKAAAGLLINQDPNLSVDDLIRELKCEPGPEFMKDCIILWGAAQNDRGFPAKIEALKEYIRQVSPAAKFLSVFDSVRGELAGRRTELVQAASAVPALAGRDADIYINNLAVLEAKRKEALRNEWTVGLLDVDITVDRAGRILEEKRPYVSGDQVFTLRFHWFGRFAILRGGYVNPLLNSPDIIPAISRNNTAMTRLVSSLVQYKTQYLQWGPAEPFLAEVSRDDAARSI